MTRTWFRKKRKKKKRKATPKDRKYSRPM